MMSHGHHQQHCVRLASLNVNGLRTRLHSIVENCVKQRLDVVCLQDTRALASHIGQLNLAVDRLADDTSLRLFNCPHTGFDCYWAPAQSTRVGGVAIWLRRSSLVHGGVRLLGECPVHEDGRSLTLRLNLGGHVVALSSVYVPAQPQPRLVFLQQRLPQVLQVAGDPLLMGDWNFAESPVLDRVRRQQPPAGQFEGQHAADQPAINAFRSVTVDLHDVFRVLHPVRRSYTYFHTMHASRLDRVYCTGQLLPWVHQCAVSMFSPSDHRQITLRLLMRSPVDQGPGVKRCRLHFSRHADTYAAFETWLAEQVGQAPDDDADLLLWWPTFKRICAAKIVAANRAARDTIAAQQVGATAAQQRLRQIYADVETGAVASLDDLTEARRQYSSGVDVAVRQQRLSHRRAWVHMGERPQPSITQQLRPPVDARRISGLRHPSGHLAAAGSGMAQIIADYWAGISSAEAQEVLAAAEGAGNGAAAAAAEECPVLAAVRQHAANISEPAAAALGATEVTVEEVLRALKRTKSGTSPGLDGLPVEFYRRFREQLVPLLSRVFSAMGAAQMSSARFTDGVITTIYKRGQRSEPASYRPITLLNTDYRLLAKVLANRLLPVLGEVISAEQTAFLHGRNIGENLSVLQSLPQLLSAQRGSALIMLLDFAKAYDTVRRGFLRSVMEAMGVGSGFLAWVDMLLGDTRTCAVVNGYVSDMRAFTAGVRQGCPLAPLLYLFVGEALLLFLRQRGFGVTVAGRRTVATQYADDMQVMLEGIQHAPTFLAAMGTFGAASGQRLNVSKSEAMLVGDSGACHQQRILHAALLDPPAGPDAPHVVCGVRLVTSAKVLGVTIRAPTGTASVAWTLKQNLVTERYTRIAALGLSVFGRAFASSGYGLSRLLYHAEHVGMPPRPVLVELQRLTSRLVDRGQPPGDRTQRFAGVRSDLQFQRPLEGGLGVLPLKEHVLARHAVWAARLMSPAADAPWAAFMHALARCSFAGWQSLQLAVCPGGGRLPAGLPGSWPQPLRRLVEGFCALPPVRDVNATPLVPGDWCWDAPVWGNPFLCVGGAAGPRLGLEAEFPLLCVLGTVRTVGHVLLAESAVAECLSVHGVSFYQQHLWPEWFARAPAFEDGAFALQQLRAVLACLPHAWLSAVHHILVSQRQQGMSLLQPVASAAAERAASQLLFDRLGWLLPDGNPVKVSGLTVHAATVLQLEYVREGRRSKHVDFVECALSRPLAGAGEASLVLKELLSLFKRYWKLRWDNRKKEVFWRLSLDGLPTAARMHLTGQSCPCGVVAPGRRHCYWECAVALAVREEIERQLPAISRPVSCSAVWLCQAPVGVVPGVWPVVCLSALNAMDFGRRFLARGQVAGDAVPADPVSVAANRAVAKFWDELADFAALGLASPALVAAVGSVQRHPFLCWAAPLVQASMVVHRRG